MKYQENEKRLKFKIVENSNTNLYIAKLFGGKLGINPISAFWVEGHIQHFISSGGMVYKDGIVIDVSNGHWTGKGLSGIGRDSLEETLKGLPSQTIGMFIKKVGSIEPCYFELPEFTPKEYVLFSDEQLLPEAIENIRKLRDEKYQLAMQGIGVLVA